MILFENYASEMYLSTKHKMLKLEKNMLFLDYF